jgi:hypothetical protein
MAGAMNGQFYQAIFLSFYIARLAQYFSKTIKGIDMFQSNMICVLFAVVSFNHGFGQSSLATAQCVMMLMDAYIGTVLFMIKKNIHINMIDSLKMTSASKISRGIRLVAMEATENDENYQKC